MSLEDIPLGAYCRVYCNTREQRAYQNGDYIIPQNDSSHKLIFQLF